jgi:hypothetical protein
VSIIKIGGNSQAGLEQGLGHVRNAGNVLLRVRAQTARPEYCSGKKLEYIHAASKVRFPFISRIATAIYEHETDPLKTFVHSSGGDEPLSHYQVKLDASQSLREVLEKERPWIVNELKIHAVTGKEHAKCISRQGYQTSYAMPMHCSEHFLGFLFSIPMK